MLRVFDPRRDQFGHTAQAASSATHTRQVVARVISIAVVMAHVSQHITIVRLFLSTICYRMLHFFHVMLSA
jgi:hypothetical protein